MYTAFSLPPPTFIYPPDCSDDSFQQFMVYLEGVLYQLFVLDQLAYSAQQ